MFSAGFKGKECKEFQVFIFNNFLNCQTKQLLQPVRVTTLALVRTCVQAPKEGTKKIVGYWLFGSAGMVFVAVVLGLGLSYIGCMWALTIVIEEIIKITIR